MSELGDHCPFLNRADSRCTQHFHLEALPRTFRYCFGQYQACPIYLERLIERRIKRSVGEHHATQSVQVTISSRLRGSAAAGAAVSRASGG